MLMLGCQASLQYEESSEMLIFYDEAAKILDYSEDAVRHAAVRGDLTRAGTQGNRQRVIKEQVMLFTGVNPRTGKKKWIRYDALDEQGQALWNRYASEAQHPALSVSPVDEEAIRRVVSQQTTAIQESVQNEVVNSLIQSLQGLLSPKQTAIV
jgi:hypothetical protein